MATNGDSHQDTREPSRVRKASEVHKRRIDKTARRSLRKKEQEIAREQVELDNREEADRQARFTVIHGERPVRVPDARRTVSGNVRDEDSARREQAALHAEAPHAEAQRAAAQHADGRAPVEVAPEGQREDGPASAKRLDASADDANPQSVADVTPKELAADLADGDGVADEADEADASGNPPRKPHRVRRIVLIVIAIIIAVIAILMGLFCWNRWLRYDDAAEIQGEWFVASSGRRAPVTIDGDAIVFNPETKWHYKLDPAAKTIAFTFGSQSGGGRYRFADNRRYLIIEDGVGYSAFDTFLADLQLTLTGQADVVPQGDAVTVLSRSATVSDGVAAPAESSSSVIMPPEETADAEPAVPDDGEEQTEEPSA